MCTITRVRWTLIAQTPPQPWLTCQGCSSMSAYRSSGKIRLNANGRRLDAWLIYNCSRCGKSWNRPIFERRNVRDIDPVLLDALQRNDPELVRRHAFDLDALRRMSGRIDAFADHLIEKTALATPPEPTLLHIAVKVPVPLGLRLDRLLAQQLDLSRNRLQQLYAKGIVAIQPERGQPLRRPVADGTEVTIDLAGVPDGVARWVERATAPCRDR